MARKEQRDAFSEVLEGSVTTKTSVSISHLVTKKLNVLHGELGSLYSRDEAKVPGRHLLENSVTCLRLYACARGRGE